MRRSRETWPPLLIRVCAEIGRGRITEATIHDRGGLMTEGFFDPASQQITVDPCRGVVSVVVHEALHRLYPAWPESYVLGRTTWLLNRLTPQEQQAIYREYGARKRCRSAAKVVD